MNECLSKNQWLACFEGGLNASDRRAVERHLASCANCRDRFHALERLSAELEREASGFREALAVPAADMERMFASMLDRIRNAARDAGDEVLNAGFGSPVRLALTAIVRALLPIYGANLTRAALDHAARSCHAATADSVTEAQWPAFVAGLVPTVCGLCGVRSAKLISDAGLRLAGGESA